MRVQNTEDRQKDTVRAWGGSNIHIQVCGKTVGTDNVNVSKPHCLLFQVIRNQKTEIRVLVAVTYLQVSCKRKRAISMSTDIHSSESNYCVMWIMPLAMHLHVKFGWLWVRVEKTQPIKAVQSWRHMAKSTAANLRAGNIVSWFGTRQPRPKR